MLDGRVYAEFGIYSMDYIDMQLAAFQLGTDTSFDTTVNAGNATIEGADASIRLVAGGFGINGSLTWNESNIEQLTTVDTRSLPFDLPAGGTPYPGDTNLGCNVATAPNGCFDYSSYVIGVSNVETLFAPGVTYNFSVDYAFQLSNGATVTPSVALNHADAAFSNINQVPGDSYFQTGERDLVNFTLTYQKDDWNVQLFGTNVSDELFIEGVSSNDSVLYGDPSVWGIRARMDF
jgi:iron complex outermembrane receptor protein